MADENIWNADNGATDQSNPNTPDTTSAGNETPTTPIETASTGAAETENHPTDAAATQVVPPVSDDTPDYASAKGEQTVVSNAPAEPSPSQPAYGQNSPYRPAPQYGAYGPVPTPPAQPAQPAAGQQTQPMQPVAQNGNPFTQPNRNPFGSNGQPGTGNPYARPTGPAAPQSPRGPQGPQFPPQGPASGNPFGPNGQPGQPGQPGQGQAGVARKPMSEAVRGVIIAVVAALVAAALCLGLGFAAISNGWITMPTTNSLANVNSNQSGSGSATAKTGEAPNWQAVAEQVSGSVVAIQTVVDNGSAKGSGAIIDAEKGYIVTNNHVVSGAKQIQVTLSNGQMYAAQIVGTDVSTDLAVIKLDNPPSGLKAVEFADSDKLAVGENVMAVGNPLGYDDTATTGIVSALNRPVSVMDEDSGSQIVTNAVQIDAAINPGNSGGPTFNAAGQVIGINSSIASTSSSSGTAGSIGIGFAIPSNLVKRVADEIIKDGKATHVALGVTIKSAVAEADGVVRGGAQITTPSTGGSAVVSGGPADKAGLKVNDTIVAFNGKAVNNNESLLGFVRAASLGDKVTLTIVRDSKTMDVELTLDQKEDAVNGSNRSESNSQGNGSDGSDGNGQGGSGNGFGGGQDGQGQGDGSDGSDGGFDGFLPFGF